MRGIYKRLLLWVMNTGAYEWSLKHVLPYIRFSLYYTKMNGFKYHEGYKVLQAGDILLSVDRKKLTTLLIGGEFSHAAMCVSVGGWPRFETCEMTHNDFEKRYFFDFCKEADRVVILRCPSWDSKYKQQVIKNVLDFSRAKYDINFTLEVAALYCSELIYQADYEKRLLYNLEDLAGIGVPYISPTGLYHIDNIDVVYDSGGVG